MKLLLGLLSAISLIVCTMVGFIYFQGSITMSQYKTMLLIASILYFIFATLWATWTKRGA